jgi:methylated-DNA-protein-cysteine methyltransferase-like protein
MRAGDAYSKIYAVVRRIPSGRVASYGQVARWAGLPGRARQVGYALHAIDDDDDGIPWQRVVNARGEVSSRSEPGMENLQRAMLEAEGVNFDLGGRLDLERFGWWPRGR